MKCLLAIAAAGTLAAAAPLEVPFFQQQKNGCGAASVAMVMQYWRPGSPPAPQVYRELYRPERKGIPLADMRRYLDDSGFRAFTLRGEWSDLETHVAKGRPIIVSLKPRRSGRLHFAVLVGLDGDSVWLNDPTRKRPHRIKRSGFEHQWKQADRWMLLASPASTALPADTAGSSTAIPDSSARPRSSAP